MITFSYTILYVSDVARSMDFYQSAFGFKPKFRSPENDYGELISGTTTLAFASLDLASSNLKKGFIRSEIQGKPFGIELGFVSENLAETLAHALSCGGVIYEEMVEKPWGQTVAYLRDLDGFLIELCSPME
ncbi:VOC family protein [Flavobacterium sp. JP2137]|uniref:VOC family protein n=1 Tax=Flavobacterium sp. JP2137 TaxID=3414510 RepID=UPI003D3003A3